MSKTADMMKSPDTARKPQHRVAVSGRIGKLVRVASVTTCVGIFAYKNMETNNNILKKINDLTAAYKEFLRDESRYSLKKNLLELCEKYRITPRELSDFIEEVDIEHDQTSTVSIEKVNEEEDEDEEGNSILAKEIVELAEVVDEQPDEDKCYPPGWSN